MAEESTFDRIVSILKDQEGLDNVDLKPDTKLSEVGLDSMSTVEAVMACEDEFGIEIDPEANPQTVQEFVDLVDEQLKDKDKD
ncbi:acyl carrier protein [Atopobium sp. oral taxon 416]|uniref:acyl carrier protein n=1 Tax=Atopobium sp. oral taxon 416 TaxID=712157 RepID=UPI001BA9F37C|nr:phosphopantetheine-binding protein [Atopobium sp. oral taxon 416]QUC03573.1 acyl carrier protein [Atopobium sp. oral taxon 416]